MLNKATICQVCALNIKSVGSPCCLPCWIQISTGIDIHTAVSLLYRPNPRFSGRALFAEVCDKQDWLILDGSLIKKDTIIKVCEQTRIYTQAYKAAGRYIPPTGLTGLRSVCELDPDAVDNKKWAVLKQHLLTTNAYQCGYCFETVPQNADVDTVIPLPLKHTISGKGRWLYWEINSQLGNSTISCKGCNVLKGVPENSARQMLRHIALGKGLFQFKCSTALTKADLPATPRLSFINTHRKVGVGYCDPDLPNYQSMLRAIFAQLAFRAVRYCPCDYGCSRYHIYLDMEARTLVFACPAIAEPALGQKIGELHWPFRVSRVWRDANRDKVRTQHKQHKTKGQTNE